MFDFGVPKDTQVFFSRRIGISSGEAVPILGGARLTQKVGRFDVGILDMQTEGLPGPGSNELFRGPGSSQSARPLYTWRHLYQRKQPGV